MVVPGASRSPLGVPSSMEFRETSLYVFGRSCLDVMDVGLAHYGVWYHTICYDTSPERNSLYHRLHHTASVCCVSHADRCNLLIEVSYGLWYGTIPYLAACSRESFLQCNLYNIYRRVMHLCLRLHLIAIHE